MRGESRIIPGAKHALPRDPKEQPKKRRLKDCEKYLPRGKRMVSVSLPQERGNINHNRLCLLQREAKHEAQVLQQISDHPGIPLLFGISLKEMPVSIVLKFHGEGGQSLTVHKVAKNSVISEQNNWNRILHDTVDALEHIHNCGFVHNDLKSNNVVLETA